MADDSWEAFVSMWQNIDDAFLESSAGVDFASTAQDLFTAGFIDAGGDADYMQWARDEFFALMEEFDISIEVFDWDDWRDWYESA